MFINFINFNPINLFIHFNHNFVITISFLLVEVFIKVILIMFFILLNFILIFFSTTIHIKTLSYLYLNFNFNFILCFHYDNFLHFTKLMIHHIILIICSIDLKNYHTD